jgi:hypothetical protein
MIQKAVHRWHAWRLEKHRLLFERLLANPQSGVGMMVQNRAVEMAMHMVSNWLDRKRIMHCARCPATESLKTYRDKYWCLGHHRQVTAEDEEKAQLASASN